MGRVTIYSSLAALILGAAGAWLFQSNRYDAKIMEMQKDAAVILAESHRRAKSDYEYLEKVKNDAIKVHKDQVAKQKASADAARASADSLRKDLASVPDRIANASRAAVDEYTVVQGGLFGNCTAEYQRVADEAKANASNAELMLNSWPKREKAP